MTDRMKAVLVTGAASGIGRATALELDRRGFQVYAGVRRDADAEGLRNAATGDLRPVMLDVTIPEQLRSVRDELERAHGAEGLYALVNVAGIADFGPIEDQSPERLRKIFDVNFFGVLATIQALLPLIRRARGRIVNVGSVGAHGTIPFGFTVCSSKHAVEALTSGLRMELSRWGIAAIAIDPSSIATPAADRMVDQAKAAIVGLSEEQRGYYADGLLTMAASMRKQEMAGMPPEGVGKVIAKALSAKRPRARYPVGPHARTIILMSGLLPDRWMDKLILKMVGIRMNDG
ncbi:MAG TPA: SDR family oxidoreductase [Gammaproteobacteria bacterium]|nr:SDR family oxidoreductase [Gammaproteobacteria bacterium]